MVELADVPPEILYNIIEYLNILDNKGTQLVRYVQPRHGPAHVGITFHKSNPDTSLFDAMRVCKSWRDLIFQQVFKEDVTKWSLERWQEEIDRFRTVERLALIEMTKMCVTIWQKLLLEVPVLHEREPMRSTEIIAAAMVDHENEEDDVEGGSTDDRAELQGSAGNLDSDHV